MSRVGCSAPSDDAEGATLTARPPPACPPLVVSPDTWCCNLRISTACSLHFKSSRYCRAKRVQSDDGARTHAHNALLSRSHEIHCRHTHSSMILARMHSDSRTHTLPLSGSRSAHSRTLCPTPKLRLSLSRPAPHTQVRTRAHLQSTTDSLTQPHSRQPLRTPAPLALSCARSCLSSSRSLNSRPISCCPSTRTIASRVRQVPTVSLEQSRVRLYWS